MTFGLSLSNLCKDLYPNDAAVLTAAQNAFTQVGIGSGGSTTGSTYQQDLPANAGADRIVYVTDDGQKLIVTTPTNAGPTVLYSEGIISRPSVTDDGSIIVFVGEDKKIHGVVFDWANNTIKQKLVVQDEAIWHNVAISKDGKKLAANFDEQDSTIWVYSFDLEKDKYFTLYNPTTATGGTKSNEVRYSDALEWDHYGEYVMYDAFNNIPSSDGADLEYWDVGFLNVWSNTTKNFETGKIEKLFSDLPEGVSIGDATFAKNSPYIVAFDYIESSPLLGDSYYIYGANIQTGDLTTDGTKRGIVENNDIGYPSYSRDDKRLLYTTSVGGVKQIKTVTLATNKINPTSTNASIASDAKKGNWFGTAKRVISATNELDKTKVAISPNPFHEVLTLDITSEKSGNGKAEIFDLLGRSVLSTTPQYYNRQKHCFY